MKKDSEEKILDLANWFSLNILIAFAPFIVINLMNFIIGYNIGLEDIISDYAGLTYSTSVVLLVCILDSVKRNGKLIVTHLLLQYAIVSFIVCMLFYAILNVFNKVYYRVYNERDYYEMLRKMFYILTGIMVFNISVIILIKIKEWFAKDKE